MNSQTNLTAAKIRRMLLITALVICPLFATATARAQGDTVTATLLGSDMTNIVNITGNQSFTLTLSITTDFLSSGITFFLQSTNGSGLFRLTGRDFTLQGGFPFPYEDDTNSNATVLEPGAALLDPVNNFDLGATNDGVETDAPGSYTIALLTFSTLNAPVGQYTIFIDRGVVTDRDGDLFIDRPFMAMATINVIPEPTTVGLAVIGGGVLLVAAYRKRRARA